VRAAATGAVGGGEARDVSKVVDKSVTCLDSNSGGGGSARRGQGAGEGAIGVGER
jgi:hypothetical protein